MFGRLDQPANAALSFDHSRYTPVFWTVSDLLNHGACGQIGAAILSRRQVRWET